MESTVGPRQAQECTGRHDEAFVVIIIDLFPRSGCRLISRHGVSRSFYKKNLMTLDLGTGIRLEEAFLKQ